MKKPSARRILIIFLSLVVAGCSSSSASTADKVTASGFVEGQSYNLLTQIGGKVAQVEIALGDDVEKDQVLIQFDTQALESQRSAADAGLAGARAAVNALEEWPSQDQLTQAEANLELAKANYEAAQTSLDLLTASYEPLDPPAGDLHQALNAIDIAQAEVELAQATLNQVKELPMDAQWDVAEAGVDEAEANIALLERQEQEYSILSPISGVVSQVLVRQGEVVPPGGSVARVLDPAELFLKLYIPVDQVSRIAIGDRVEITTDSYPGEQFAGKVNHIADQAQFTPTLVLTAEERVKLVFEVVVKIEEGLDKIKPGMPVDAEIQSG